MSLDTPLRFTISRVGEATPSDYDKGIALDSPQAVVNFWHTVVAKRPDHEADKECLVSVVVNAKMRPIGYHLIALGSLNECIAHPREILRPAIVMAAYAFILAHNHPSGDPAPSQADHRLTRRIHEAAELLQIRLLDHVIIGDEAGGRDASYSFREAGVL